MEGSRQAGRKTALTHRPVPLAIIGGGAAGLFAAAAAARRRMGCLVFERKARIGSKLLMTANGRCNFTKDISAEQMLADIGEPVASFVAPALRRCPPSMIAAAEAIAKGDLDDEDRIIEAEAVDQETGEVLTQEQQDVIIDIIHRCFR